MFLGQIYFYGLLGKERDTELGTYWYEQAVENGRADLYAELGNAYKLGFYRMPIDLWRAVDFYTKGAQAGDAECQYSLGVLYYLGRGVVPKDYILAHKWVQEAANRNHSDAISALGSLPTPISAYDKIRYMLSESNYRINMAILSRF